MEEYILTVINGADNYQVSASSRISILDNLRDADIHSPDAPCGGAGTCHKCTVTVTGAVRFLDTGTIRDVVDQELLACRYAPAGPLRISIPCDTQMNVVTDGAQDLAATLAEDGLGLAVDIGTTTIAVFLYDLSTGTLMASGGERNEQRVYGADVISRINACSEGKLSQLASCVQRQIEQISHSLCQQVNVRTSDIRHITIAGNTVMEHLFAGLSPISIGVAPFTPESLFGGYLSAATILPGLETNCDMYLCPCLSGYVGGDITAGLMATDSQLEEGLRLFVDIGTNGEMALGNKEGYITCATAAGPAFEGAEITCGMGGGPGAIDKVSLTAQGLMVHTIEDQPAQGVCGSGLIDAIACMLKSGVITESGRMVGPEELEPVSYLSEEGLQDLRARIFTDQNGHHAFRLTNDIYISAEDVREVQLAKAAIRAGAETLLQAMGKTVSDITDLVIAGGFGSYLNKESALTIGLLPEVPSALIRHAGNTAGAGAAIALTSDGTHKLTHMTELCTYLELSTSGEFMDNYIEYMAF